MGKTARIVGNSIMAVPEKNEFARITPDMPWLYEAVLSQIERFKGRIRSVLDVGCADGLLLSMIHERHPELRLAGIDADPYFIAQANAKRPFRFVVQDASQLSQSADLIISNLTLHHFEDLPVALRKMNENARVGVIVSDQLRPDTENELDARLARRKTILQIQTPFYDIHERRSILEAYSRKEIAKILYESGIPFDVRFIDRDYYERIVASHQRSAECVDATQHHEQYERRITQAIERAKQLLERRGRDESVTDFDIRGELYDLAHQLAPDARNDEVQAMYEWTRPRRGERALDIAAGTGFLTRKIRQWTDSDVYAVDSSAKQLWALQRNAPEAQAIHASPDDIDFSEKIRPEKFDFATSLGGFHHIPNQRRAFVNVADALKENGRFVVADVCAGTSVARHFDFDVANHCITGHTAKWLDEQRILELTRGLPLRITRLEMVPICMTFESETEIALFFTGLHAYDLSQNKVIDCLHSTLGIEKKDGLFLVQWPLLMAYLEKQ